MTDKPTPKIWLPCNEAEMIVSVNDKGEVNFDSLQFNMTVQPMRAPTGMSRGDENNAIHDR